MPAVVKKPEGAKKLPAVPESKLKHEKRRISARASLIQRKFKKRSKILLRKRENFQRAETYEREYKKLERSEIDLKREAKKVGSYYIPAEAKLAFVIRIRGYVFKFFLGYV